MKKYFYSLTIILVLILTHSSAVKSQSSVALNTSGTNTHYLGWDDNTTFDLLIKHEGTFGIQFWSDDQLRMILQANGALNYGANTLNEPSSVCIGDGNLISNLSDHSFAVGSVNVVDTCLYCFDTGEGNSVGGATSGDIGCKTDPQLWHFNTSKSSSLNDSKNKLLSSTSIS